MEFTPKLPLARLRPRDDIFYVSRNRTVLATARDGFIYGGGKQGLFVFQTRLLSTYRCRINGQEPQPVAISNIAEHSQIAYYVVESPNPDHDLFRGALGPGGRAATETIELRISRFVSDGLQEDIELSNHTLRPVNLTLELEVDGDFADAGEAGGERRQNGRIERDWRQVDGAPELVLSYTGRARLRTSRKPWQGDSTPERGDQADKIRIGAGLRRRAEANPVRRRVGPARNVAVLCADFRFYRRPNV